MQAAVRGRNDWLARHREFPNRSPAGLWRSGPMAMGTDCSGLEALCNAVCLLGMYHYCEQM